LQKKKLKFPNVSIVIATYNRANTLRKVLLAMLKLDYPARYEIIVVNDGSTDNTKEMLTREFLGNKKITIVNFEKNQGVCKARNEGIKLARYEIVVNMDHDCIPSKTWLRDLIKGFTSKKVGVVSSYGGFGGTSTAFRKELLEKVGGYDEDYRYYREDTDLTFKIIELGYEYKLVKADYFHDHIETKPAGFFGLLKYAFQRLRYHQNDVLLYKKHPNELTRKFLHIRFGFLVDPIYDFKVATGLWKNKGSFELSSPRGIVFIQNKTPLHAFAIVLAGIGYVVAVKLARFWASIKLGKLLI